MRRLAGSFGVGVLAAFVSLPAAYAQGGGASATGSITGRVVDAGGAVLPGVAVTLSGPALMGTQTAVTNDVGLYRFPAIPPGRYVITYELPGFSTLRREGIDVGLGFTATINVELAVAALEETLTVTGESPVIDTSATRVQQNFRLEQLESIPNARDMWGLLALTPGVSMTRIDVGGNRAGTQTGYIAYGITGQVRVLVEGINTTEGTGGAGFYFDYGSFEEVFLGTAGQGAEMPHPGVQSQFLGKSGGNNFQGQVYADWYNNSLQGSNITETHIAQGIREGGNEVEGYYDFNLNLGGPIKRDKVWWYFSYRDQKNQVLLPNFLFDTTFDTRLWNPSGKVTYQLSQDHRFIGYYQWGQKIQPYRTWTAAALFLTPDDTTLQDSGSWVWKGEWNGTLTNNLYMEARFGDFGYYFPLLGYSSEPFRFDTGTAISQGGDRRWQQDRDRKQATAAATYFKDGWGGSHSFKFGTEFNAETQWNAFERTVAGNRDHRLFNGASRTVAFGFPTASGPLGSYSSRKDMLSIAKLNHYSGFVSDQWAVNDRLTLNLGFRIDHYKSHIPEQQQLAFTNGPFSIPAVSFPAQTFFTWNSVVPRIGAIYNIDGTGRTVLKMNYGLFKHNPGPGIAASGNPNQAGKTVTYEWNDLNGNRVWDPGEEGAIIATALAGTISVDPNIKQPYTHEVSAFVERELIPDLGARLGVVYKTIDDDWATMQPTRPITAYTVPFNVVDPQTGQTLTLLGVDRTRLAEFPVTNVIMNTNEFYRHTTAEFAMTKRFSNRWQAQMGFGHTWSRGEPIRRTPNDPSDASHTGWGFKGSGIYQAPWDVRITPVFRHQAGPNYGRTMSITAAAATGALYSSPGAVSPGPPGATGLRIEPLNSNRQDNINVLDLRVEKAARLAGTSRVRLFIDLFNITNSAAAETIVVSTGARYQVPTNLLAPRTARIGARFEW
jgi:hypothetical protein